ncbi:hypothetical protein B0H19DRAFT_1236129 [Mycena capillaripes]|nr:hypothetical protein B0H19DRAFT_1236129 [Mycena capillaripes]
MTDSIAKMRFDEHARRGVRGETEMSWMMSMRLPLVQSGARMLSRLATMVIWRLAGNVATMADNLHTGYLTAGQKSGLKRSVQVAGGDAGGLANVGEVERTYEDWPVFPSSFSPLYLTTVSIPSSSTTHCFHSNPTPTATALSEPEAKHCQCARSCNTSKWLLILAALGIKFSVDVTVCGRLPTLLCCYPIPG